MDIVCQGADERQSEYQRLVKGIPGTARERDAFHIVIIQKQAVSEHLERIFGRENAQRSLRQTAADGIGEAEKERIARGENNYVPNAFITRENLVQRHGDINPAGLRRQKVLHYLMMAHAAREHACRGDDLHHLRREKRFASVSQADYVKMLVRHRDRV